MIQPLLSSFRLAAPVRRMAVSALVVALLGLSACAERGTKIPAGTAQPDEFLFERGNTALTEKRWFTAREFFQTLIDTYPQSTHRADAKLGLADAYLGDGSPASQVLAINEYKEFLSFFPTSPRADYAQYKLAMSHYAQMAKAGRDQTETHEAISEFQVLFEKYPNSALIPEARKHEREAKDRLGRSEYLVGLTYHRIKWYPGTVARLQALLKTDPEFSERDAVYYYLADALAKLNRQAESLPLLEKIDKEFERSEFTEKANKLLAEIKTAALTPPVPPKGETSVTPTSVTPPETPKPETPKPETPPAPPKP